MYGLTKIFSYYGMTERAQQEFLLDLLKFSGQLEGDIFYSSLQHAGFNEEETAHLIQSLDLTDPIDSITKLTTPKNTSKKIALPKTYLWFKQAIQTALCNKELIATLPAAKNIKNIPIEKNYDLIAVFPGNTCQLLKNMRIVVNYARKIINAGIAVYGNAIYLIDDNISNHTQYTSLKLHGENLCLISATAKTCNPKCASLEGYLTNFYNKTKKILIIIDSFVDIEPIQDLLQRHHSNYEIIAVTSCLNAFSEKDAEQLLELIINRSPEVEKNLELYAGQIEMRSGFKVKLLSSSLSQFSIPKRDDGIKETVSILSLRTAKR